MRTVIVAAGLAAGLLAGSAHAASARVEFVDPDRFTDAGEPHTFSAPDANLDALRRHLVMQAAKRLPADEALDISVTDVDLAGSFEPWQRRPGEVRILKDIYPPKIDLRFRLTRADGTVVKEGQRSLRDPNFLSGTTHYPSDSLRYEKTMLDEWLAREFGGTREAAAR